METIRTAKNPGSDVALPMLSDQNVMLNKVLALPFIKNLGLDHEKQSWAMSSTPFVELSRAKVEATLQA